MKRYFSALSLLLAAFLLLGPAACVKEDFDEPPTGGSGTTIPTNATIAEIKELHVTQGGYDRIPADSDLVIGGQVVMDDRSGNYYKTLVIQDASGGIEVKFNDGFLYNQFPVGRTIYIRLRGLYLTDYNGLTQLVGSVVEQGGVPEGFGLTEAQVREQVVKGTIQPVTPRVVTIAELQGNDDLISTLVQLNDVQFIGADTVETYADPVTKNSLNRTLEDCSHLQIIVRTSGYADFAGAKTPRGRGTVTGVLGVFGGTLQLYVRSLADVQMDSLRCGEVVAPPTGLTSLNETFSDVTSNQPIELGGWSNVSEVGNEKWDGRFFQGNGFAQASAFQANPASVKTWLISPALDLRTARELTFRTSWGFYVHQGVQAYVLTDFNGQNIATANKIPLTATFADANTPKDAPGSNYSVWVNSGPVALPVLPEKAYVAFLLTGDAGANTTTWRLDDVKVQ
jgi:hypothetical protein